MLEAQLGLRAIIRNDGFSLGYSLGKFLKESKENET